MDTGTTWIDMRWQEPGWREAFRLRMAGWLPTDWVTEGVRCGVVIERSDQSRMMDITARGRELTDLADVGTSNDVALQLGNMLAVHEWQRAWFDPNLKMKGGWVTVANMFPLEFRERLVEAFDQSVEQMQEAGDI
ncbi:MAG: hypothetical protein VXW43_03430 [Pseudomonadota bacterium]|jgi:hypothetical protein|nr:hypothetical protein [Pseudomonadota bacterium]